MSDTLRTDALLASHREKNKDGCCDVRRAMRQVEEIIAHARQLETELSAALQRAEKAEAEIKRAFSALSFCGVPEERARSVANGIQVFMTRIDREHATLKAELSRYHDAEKALPEEPQALALWRAMDASRPLEVVRYIDKLCAHAAALQTENEAMRKDAELGRIAMRFVDRAGDVCASDPAEKICQEFYEAIGAAINARKETL